MADLPGVEGGGSADPATAATAPVAAAAGPAASPPGSRVAKAAWRATAVVTRVEENGEYVELPGRRWELRLEEGETSRTWVIGRATGDLRLPNDLSAGVSRQHARLTATAVPGPGAGPPEVRLAVTDTSRYGSYRRAAGGAFEALAKGAATPLPAAGGGFEALYFGGGRYVGKYRLVVDARDPGAGVLLTQGSQPLKRRRIQPEDADGANAEHDGKKEPLVPTANATVTALAVALAQKLQGKLAGSGDPAEQKRLGHLLTLTLATVSLRDDSMALLFIDRLALLAET